MFIFSLSVAVTCANYRAELCPFRMAWQVKPSLVLFKPSVNVGFAASDKQYYKLEWRSFRMQNTNILSSRLKFWSNLSSAASSKPHPQMLEKRSVEWKAALPLLIFLLEIRLSVDRLGLWRMTWRVKMLQYLAVFILQVELELSASINSKIPNSKMSLCLLVFLFYKHTHTRASTHTHTHCFLQLFELNARLSDWPSGWTSEQKEG